jgi:hypothetical protein
MQARYQAKYEEWKKIIGEFEGAGLSTVAFCRNKGIKKSAFYYWQAKLAKKKTSKVTVGKVRNSFLPVTVAASKPIRIVEVKPHSLPNTKWMAEFIAEFLRVCQ